MKSSRTVIVVLVCGILSACGKPYSPLDKTEWLSIDRSVDLKFGTDDKVTLVNEAKDTPASEFTYAPSPDNPNVYIFKETTGKLKEIMRIDLSNYNKDAKDHFLLAESVFGNIRFDAPTDEIKKQFNAHVAFTKEQEKKKSIKDAPHDANRYVDVVAKYGPNWATYYVLSQDAKPTSDDDKLGMLSQKWNSTNDSFQRQAMKQAELADINGKIASIGKEGLISLSATIGGGGPWLGLDSDKGYDFAKKGFPLTGLNCNGSGISESYSNSNSVQYAVVPDLGADICFLPVTDQAIAQQIEKVRTSTGSTNAIKGRIFYKLGPVNGNSAIVLPVGAQLDLGDYFLHENNPAIYSTTIWGEERKKQ